MTIRIKRPPINKFDDLPLFLWAAQHQPRIHRTYPGRVLERRYRLSPARAELIANVYGLGGSQ